MIAPYFFFFCLFCFYFVLRNEENLNHYSSADRLNEKLAVIEHWFSDLFYFCLSKYAGSWPSVDSSGTTSSTSSMSGNKINSRNHFHFGIEFCFI